MRVIICCPDRERPSMPSFQVHHAHVLSSLLPHPPRCCHLPIGRDFTSDLLLTCLSRRMVRQEFRGAHTSGQGRSLPEGNLQTGQHTHHQRSNLPHVLGSWWVDRKLSLFSCSLTSRRCFQNCLFFLHCRGARLTFQLEPIRSKLIQLDPTRSNSIQLHPTWSNPIQLNPTRSGLIQPDPSRSTRSVTMA